MTTADIVREMSLEDVRPDHVRRVQAETRAMMAVLEARETLIKQST